MLRKLTFFLLCFCLFGLLSTGVSSCKTAEGCQMEDKYQVKTDKNGNLSTKKGKSNLFSPKDRKKMGR